MITLIQEAIPYWFVAIVAIVVLRTINKSYEQGFRDGVIRAEKALKNN